MSEPVCDTILACRLTGTRLYGKPLQLIDIQNGVTILENLVKHITSSPGVNSVILAIADEKENHAVVDVAERHGWGYVFGDPKDVLGRIIKAADEFGTEIVLRATSECPFAYHEGIDSLLASHIDGGHDYSMYEKMPEGGGFSLVNAEALRRSHRQGSERHRSELVTSYIFDNRDEFRINPVPLPEELRRPEVRITVDYPEDLVFCRRVYRDLGGASRLIPMGDIVRYWDDNPEARKPLEEIGIDWGHGRIWA